MTYRARAKNSCSLRIQSQCEIDPINHTRPTFDDCIAISPIATYPSPPTILLRPPTLVHDPKHSFPALFIPDYSSITDKPDLSALPIDLTLSLQNLFDHYLSKHAMDYTGKQTDVIDFGGETNYEGHAWFQNAPTPPPVSSINLWTYIHPGVLIIYSTSRPHRNPPPPRGIMNLQHK